MALPNDMSRMSAAFSKVEGSSTEYDGDIRLAGRTLIRKSVTFATTSVLANGSNNVVPNAAPSIKMLCNGRALGGCFIPQGTATAAGANNATIAVKTIFANGVVNVTLASATTNTVANGGTGNLAAGVAVTLTATDIANARFAAGTVIGPAVTQNGSGVAMPAGTVQLDFELESADGIYSLSPS